MNRLPSWQQFASPTAEVLSAELLDLRSVYRIIRCRLHIIALCVFVGLCLAATHLVFTTPLYTATAELFIDTREKKAIDFGEVLPGLGSDSAAIDSEVEIIRSSSVARRVIAKLQQEHSGELEASNTWGLNWRDLLGYFGLQNDETAQSSDAAQVARDEQLDTQLQKFAKGLTVKRVGLTYVISVSYTSRDPSRAATLANLVTQTYLLHQLDSKFEATKRASDWLQERLKTLSDKVNESEKAVEAYRALHNLVGSEQETPYDAQLRKLNEELATAQVEMDERMAKLQQAREIVRTKQELTSIDAVVISDVVKNLREALAMVGREEAELTTRFTDKHPKVLQKRAERQDLKRRIAEEAERIVLNLENEYKIAKLRQASIETSLQDLKNKTKGARSSLIRLKELDLEAEANRAIYKALLNRFKETTQQETLLTANSRIITEAMPPRSKSSPKTTIVLVLSLLVSSIAGLGIVFVLNHLDDRVKTGDQIESKLNVPHLASLPKLSRGAMKRRADPAATGRSSGAELISAYTEAIRTLNISLQQTPSRKGGKAVLITSSYPGEGKSTLAENLSKYAAQIGLRTLLIDADLRRPSLSERMGDRSVRGLVNVLTCKQSAMEAAIHHPSGVHFLQGAAIPGHAAEMLSAHTMEDLLDWARSAYDLVLVDTAPVLPVVDARVLARLVDEIVFVIEWNSTALRIAAHAIKSLQVPQDRIAGVLLNKVDLPRMAFYRGEDYHRYEQAYAGV